MILVKKIYSLFPEIIGKLLNSTLDFQKLYSGNFTLNICKKIGGVDPYVFET